MNEGLRRQRALAHLAPRANRVDADPLEVVESDLAEHLEVDLGQDEGRGQK